MALLEIRDLTKKFGGLTAVDSVHFQVNEGQILGLIGPNGAGKTTIFNMITGIYPPTDGEVHFREQRIAHPPLAWPSPWFVTVQAAPISPGLVITDGASILVTARSGDSMVISWA